MMCSCKPFKNQEPITVRDDSEGADGVLNGSSTSTVVISPLRSASAYFDRYDQFREAQFPVCTHKFY
jgi:hypothetical protein